MSEGSWIPTVDAEAIDTDFPSMALIGTDEVALCRAGDSVFAVANICTHAYARLSDGHVDDGQVFCPLHQGSFDIRTGEAVASPCYEPVHAYETKVENGTVYVWSIPRPLAG